MMKKFLGLVLYINIFMLVLCGTAFASFSDTTVHWASEAISDFEAKGFVKGYGDGTFKPNQDITRAEFATIVNGFMGYEVDDGDWQVANLATAKDKSYMDVKDPSSSISREESAVIFAKLFKVANEVEANPDYIELKDIDAVSVWARLSVTNMSKLGYIKGYTNGMFAPSANITRAEVVTILNRYVVPQDVVVEPDSAEFSVGYLTSKDGVVKFNKIDKEIELEEGNMLALSFTLEEDEEDPTLAIKSGSEVVELDLDSDTIIANAKGEAVIAITTDKRVEEIKVIIK